jgi:uncharacterized phage protein gp47/JayE
MADYGVLPEGFVRKDFTAIRADFLTALQSVIDPTTGQSLSPNLADENDPLAQIVNTLTDQLATLWEHAESCYNQFDPLRASDTGLTGLVQLNGIRRLPGFPSTDVFTLTGTPNTTISAGKQVANAGRDIIFTLPAFTLDGSGTVTGVIGTCTVDGPVEPTAGALIYIVTPDPNLDGATNLGTVVVGQTEESDEDLRYRQQRSTANTGASPIETFFSGVSNVSGVTFCRVYQNKTLVPDVRGIPGKTVATVVVGGDDTEIAEAIFSKLPVFGDTHGNTTETLTDAIGQTYDIKFTRPIEVSIFIEIEISLTQAYLWPSDGADRVKANIVQYASGGASVFGINSGFDRNGWLPGESVYNSELYIPVMQMSGVRINTLTVGTSDPPMDSSVNIEWDEIATFSVDNISVTVV